MNAASTSKETAPRRRTCGTGASAGAGRRSRYSGDLSGWSGRQARHGVQPAFRAAASVILSRSLSPMKRMRMQWALWYLGTPGTTVTSMLGSRPAGSAPPGCLSCSGGSAGEVTGALPAMVMPGTSVSSGSDAEAASEAGGAEKLTAAVGNESAASTVGHAFLRDTAEGIGAGFDMGRSAGGAGGAMVMLGAAAGLSVGLVHSVILSVSKNRRELYELDTLQIGEAFGESSIVGPGRSAHGYLFFTKQDYQGVRFLLGGHDSNGGATCETIQAPWGRDWHSEPGATSAVDKPQCFSR